MDTMGLQNSTGASSVRFNTPEDWPEWSNAIKTMATASSATASATTIAGASTDYRRSIKEKTDLRDMYTTLREHYTPFETMIFRKVRTAYKDHIQQAKKYENKMGEWVTQWKSLMDEAIRQDIPDAKDPKSWFTDLTEAMIRSVTGRGIADGYLLSVQAEVYAGKIGYKTLGVTLAQRFATTKSTARPPKAAFPAFQEASGNDEDERTDRGSRRGGRETRRGRGRGNNAAAPADGGPRGARGARPERGSGQARGGRRSREASDKPDRKKARFNSPGRGTERCEACQSSYHGLPDCWYVNPEDATDRWTPNSQITSLVQMRITSHPDLAARVEAVQLERRQRQG